MQGLDVSIGHVRGSSWLHRCSPIPKLTWVLAVILFAFATAHPVPLLAAALLGLLLAVTAGVGRPLLRVLIVFAPVTASMIVIQTMAPATCGDQCTAVASIGPITLYQEGMSHGLTLVSRILAMEVVALSVLLTTHPSDLFAAFARLRVPYLLNVMIAMTLQLVPVLQREVATVLAAQRARGMSARGFGAVIPSFVPVFAGAFERVQRLSISLESRGFGSSGPTTSYREVRFGLFDAVLTVLGLLGAGIGVLLGLTLWSAAQTPVVVLPAALTVALFVTAGAVFLAVIGAGLAALVRA